LGDTLQFIRYASLVKALGGRVIFACPRKLIPLLTSCPGIDHLYGEDDDDPPRYDVHAALLSLPGMFRTDLESIPADVPYLSPSDELVAEWRERLPRDGSLRVGIAWQGSPKYAMDAVRSIPLTEFAPLSEVPGLKLFSLQKGLGSEQLGKIDWPIEELGSQLDEGGRAFLDTSAVMKNLDLVITSDTSIAHLAGALGVPTWIALSFSPDWRWMLEREDSPWYPTVRLFRQQSAGDWAGVFARIKTALAALASQ
jgi:hypothetical protein